MNRALPAYTATSPQRLPVGVRVSESSVGCDLPTQCGLSRIVGGREMHTPILISTLALWNVVAAFPPPSAQSREQKYHTETDRAAKLNR
jgi:hypothetical protein